MPQVKEELLTDEVYDGFIEEAVKRSDAFGVDVYDEENCLSFLNELSPYRINPDSCSNTSGYMYRICEKTKQMLLRPNQILDWSYPDFPDDLAFYKNGYCWFYSNIQDEEIILCVDNESDIAFWNKIGIEFYDNFDYYNDVVNRIFCKYDSKKAIIDNEITG